MVLDLQLKLCEGLSEDFLRGIRCAKELKTTITAEEIARVVLDWDREHLGNGEYLSWEQFKEQSPGGAEIEIERATAILDCLRGWGMRTNTLRERLIDFIGGRCINSNYSYTNPENTFIKINCRIDELVDFLITEVMETLPEPSVSFYGTRLQGATLYKLQVIKLLEGTKGKMESGAK